MCDVSPYVQPHDDADVRRADAMTIVDYADARTIIRNKPLPTLLEIHKSLKVVITELERNKKYADAIDDLVDAAISLVRAINTIVDVDLNSLPRHISKLAGRTPVGQRSSDRRSEPESGHAQQVDDAPIINHARKPSESSGRGSVFLAYHNSGSDGRRASPVHLVKKALAVEGRDVLNGYRVHVGEGVGEIVLNLISIAAYVVWGDAP